MKRIFTLMIALFLGIGYTTVSAQDDAIMDFDFKMREETHQMSRTTANAFVLSWSKADSDMIGKAWKKYAKGLGGKLKYDRNINEYFLDNAEVDGLDNAVDITTKTNKAEAGAEMTFWFNGGVTYIKSDANPEAFVAVEKLMRNFDSFVYSEIMRRQIKEEEKQLKEIARAMRKEKREITKQERGITKQERGIKKAERDIKKAQEQIDKSQQEIEKVKVSISEQEEKENKQKALIEQMRQRLKTAQ